MTNRKIKTKYQTKDKVASNSEAVQQVIGCHLQKSTK